MTTPARACSRCGKVPNYRKDKNYITGREAICRTCETEIWAEQERKRIAAKKLEKLAPTHPVFLSKRFHRENRVYSAHPSSGHLDALGLDD